MATFFRGRGFSISGLGDLSLLSRLLPVRYGKYREKVIG